MRTQNTPKTDGTKKGPETLLFWCLSFIAVCAAFYGQLKDISQLGFQILVATGLFVVSTYLLIGYIRRREKRHYEWNTYALLCVVSPVSFVGMGYCVYTYFTRECLLVSQQPDFHSEFPTALAYEEGLPYGKAHPDYDLVMVSTSLPQPLVRDDAMSLRGNAFVDVDIRGGIGTEPVTIQRAEVEAERVGDAIKTELIPVKPTDMKPLLVYYYYVGDLINGHGTVPYSFFESEDHKLSDLSWPRMPVTRANEEYTIRSALAFRDSGSYKVQIYLLARVWPGQERRIALLREPMKVLVLDQSEHVTWVQYGNPGPGGIVSKTTWKSVPIGTKDGATTKLVPVKKQIRLKEIKGTDQRLMRLVNAAPAATPAPRQ